MKSKLEIGMIESEALMKRGGITLVNNVGKVIASITLFVAALVTFTDITFADFRTESFTLSAVMLILASYLMYFSLEDAGEQLGEETEEYREAERLYEAERDKVGGEDMDELREFCKDYARAELEYRRQSYLLSQGLTLTDLEKYRSGTVYQKKARRALRCASSFKAVSLTPKSLLTRERKSGKSELENPEKRKFFSLALRLIPTTVCMSVTVSVMLTAKEGLTAGMVIEGILKLSALPIVGFRGYASGYGYVRKSYIPWLETKRRILEAYNQKRDSALLTL